MNPLKNKVVFITGASAGIGEACAVAFASWMNATASRFSRPP
ncbi:MAG: short chain dehydrogenase [bacterium ADurb.Bin243]|nr:MAG: short chain dehydrogenase [bacterium ADurb.Bin243]